MSPNHPITGKWELASDNANAFSALEFEPSNTVIVDHRIRGRYQFIQGDRLRLKLDFNQRLDFPSSPADVWVVAMDLSDYSLKLTDDRGQTFEYKRTSFCSSEMGKGCLNDR
jgi:hypothetical protein